MNTTLASQLRLAPDRRDPNPLVLYHGKQCPDGFAAALAAWIYYEGQVELMGLDHGDVRRVADLPPLEGRAVYVLDFSFAQAIIVAMAEQAAKLVLLDHHLSAQQELAGLGGTRAVLHFDVQKSGARLAWEYFLPERAVPDLVRFVEDRDLWNWHYAESAAYLAALDMEPFDFAHWAQLAQLDVTQSQTFMARGQAMDAQFHKLACDLAQGAEPVRFNGIDGLMVNAPSPFHSLVGELLSRQSGTFALMWVAGKGGVVKVGLRAQRNFDCIALAASMGGGGHAQACGFKMAAARLPQLLSGVFNAGE